MQAALAGNSAACTAAGISGYHLAFQHNNNNGTIPIPAGQRPKLLKESVWESKGRRFAVRAEELPPPAGATSAQYTLSIVPEGGPIIQLVYPQEEFTFDTSGERLLFSGHSFEATSDPGVFRIDGVEQTVGGPGARLVAFVNGAPAFVFSG
jgi:hypothetical protein